MPAEDRRNPCSKAPLPSTSCVEGGLGRDCAEIGPRLSLGVGIAVERRAEEAPHAAEIDEIDEVSHLAAEIDEVSHWAVAAPPSGIEGVPAGGASPTIGGGFGSENRPDAPRALTRTLVDHQLSICW